jgi:integrase
MFFHSGAREIEFLNIQVADVDLVKQTFIVTVRKGRDKTPRQTVRTIKNIALPFWTEYLSGTTIGEFLFAQGWVPGPKPMTRDWLTHLWGKIVKKGLSIDIDLYSLKHLNYDETTALTDLATAAQQAGHTSMEMGKKHYAVGEKARELERLKKVANTFA